MDHAIDLRQFRYFLAVSEELHFGRAAQRLHISQPPLSRQIRQLEDQLGVALFTRSKTHVALTPAGASFLPQARRTLAQADKAVAAARSARGTGGRFAVGYTTVFDRSAIPDVMDRLRDRFPDWQMTSHGKHSINLVRDVQSGALDAAFIGLHTQAPGLQAQTLFEQPLVAALPARHPLARKRRIDFEDLGGERLFWFQRKQNPGFYDHCQAVFDQAGFKPQTVPEPADHHILLGLIAEGRGLALMPASLQQVKRQGVVFRALKGDAARLSMGIAVVHAGRNPSPVLSTFLKLVNQEAQRSPASH